MKGEKKGNRIHSKKAVRTSSLKSYDGFGRGKRREKRRVERFPCLTCPEGRERSKFKGAYMCRTEERTNPTTILKEKKKEILQKTVNRPPLLGGGKEELS